MRAKWSAPIRKYWKISEQMMVKYCDLAICDSVNALKADLKTKKAELKSIDKEIARIEAKKVKAEINFSDLKPCGCGYKISFMRFYNRIIVLYQTNILVSHFIPQNRFR